MEVFNTKREIIEKVVSIKSQKLTIGFVPTMGALHQGHLSLVKKAILNNDIVVVSIFVNPTQFDNPSDLEKYPRTLQEDLKLLKTLSDNLLVFTPKPEDIYDGKIINQPHFFNGLEFEMEGKFRKGHFDGVGTIVKKLFEIVQPTNAYFGEKDFQQLMIIKRLVKNYNLQVNIIGCDIFREKDGLAMSSRNVRLKPNYRKEAPFIYKTLKAAKIVFGTKSANKTTEWVEKQFAKNDLLELEYFEIADVNTLKTIKRKSNKKTYRAFIAVYADGIRLIDNIELN